MPFLGKGEPVTAGELEAIEAATGVAAGPGDVALVRTGYMRHWPDEELMAKHRGPGPDLSAALLLAERGVVATGSDTETYEVQPAPDPGEPANPQPVHTELLIERGIYLMESLDLEQLAAVRRAGVPVRRAAAAHTGSHRLHDRPRGGDLMRALVVHEPNSFSVEDVPRPEPGPYEVLCRVRTVALCGTDPHIIAGDFPGFWPKAFPFIPGHEWCGEVVELGEGAADLGFEEGARVAGTSHAGCGFCRLCVEGRYNICENYGDERLHRQYGHYTQGVYADYAVHSVKSVFACARHALRRGGGHARSGRDRPPHGQARRLLARRHRDRDRPRRARPAGRRVRPAAGRRAGAGGGPRRAAGQGGASWATSPWTSPRGIRWTRCASAPPAAAPTPCWSARAPPRRSPRASRCCAGAAGWRWWAFPRTTPRIPVKLLVLDELDLVGVRAAAGEMPEAIALAAAGRLRLSELITHRFSLEDFDEAYRVFTERVDGALKVIVSP